MKDSRLLLFVGVGLVLLYQYFSPDSASSNSRHRDQSNWSTEQAPSATHESTETQTQGAVPQKAYRVLDTILSTGHAPEGYVGGRVFQNREHRLPPDGDYREFDVDPHHGGRNAERIIVDWNTKQAWYTGDHYQTFIPLR